MKTFTNCAEKKAKQFLNLLQGYTKGIRMTAILVLLLMGVSNAWGKTIYLYTDEIGWPDSSAKIWVHAWGSGQDTDKQMTKVKAKLYKADIPDADTKVIFTRTQSTSTGVWDKEWDRVGEQTLNDETPCLKLTGWNTGTWGKISYDAHIYLDNSVANWNEATKEFMIGHSSYSNTYTMTNISNTKLYYLAFSNIWHGYWDYGFIGVAAHWGEYNNKDITNRIKDAAKRTGTRGDQVINGTKLFVPENASNDANLTKNDLSGYSALNYTQKIKSAVKLAGQSYDDANSKATISVTSYYLTDNATSTKQSASISTSAKSTDISAARTATTKLSVGTVATGYQFDGWYTAATGGTELSKSTTYTYYPTEAKTVYARFSEITYSVQVKSADNNQGTISPANVNAGQFTGITITATPKIGYAFKNWTATAGITITNPNSASTTIKATKAGTVTANFEAQPATTIYLEPTGHWNSHNPQYVAHVWKNTDVNVNEDIIMKGVGEAPYKYYKAEVPYGYTEVVFFRKKSDGSELWNQTADLTIPTNKNTLYEILSTGEGTSTKATGEWKEANLVYTITLGYCDFGTYGFKYNGQSYFSKKPYDNVTIDVPAGAQIEILEGQPFSNAYTGDVVKKQPTNEKLITGQTLTINGDVTLDDNFVTKTSHVVYLGIPDEINTTEIWAKADKANFIYTWDTYAGYGLVASTGNFRIDALGITYYEFTIPQGRHSFRFQRKTSLDDKGTPHCESVSLEHEIPLTDVNCFTLKNEKDDNRYKGTWGVLPAQPGDYRLLYVEQVVEKDADGYIIITRKKAHPSDIIRKGTDRQIFSLHTYKDRTYTADAGGGLTYESSNNPEIILQKYLGKDQFGNDQWEDVECQMVYGPLETLPIMANLPGRKNASPGSDIDDLRYHNGIENIKKDVLNHQDKGNGVWNFVVTQDGAGNASVQWKETQRYTGEYYIRTDNAEGGWDQYTLNDNYMTYSQYAKDHSGFSHYFCRWVETGITPNTKFVIANDYGVAISDTLAKDDYTNEHGTIADDANIRWSWNIVDNKVARAYIQGTWKEGVPESASYEERRNRNLVVNYKSSYTAADQAALLDDSGDWIYQKDFTVKVGSHLNSLTATYPVNSTNTQTFAKNLDMLTGGESNETYKVRVLYDFKINKTLVALVPNDKDAIISIDVLIERINQGEATQVQAPIAYTNNQRSGEGSTVYGVMSFDKSHLTGQSLSSQQKLTYWISFPFDVKLSEIFGFGEVGDYWMIKYYDGADRAAKGLYDDNTFWKFITNRNYTLKANQGYVLALNKKVMDANSPIFTNTDRISLYFPSKEKLLNINTGYTQTTCTIPEYTCTITSPTDRRTKDSNWNFIGVPSFANKNRNTTNENLKYFYDYDYHTDTYSVALNSRENTFKSMFAYMVQFAGIIDWSTLASNGSQSLAAKKTDNVEKHVLRIELQQNNTKVDQTYIQLEDEEVTAMFDMNYDLTKLFNSKTNIYSLIPSDTDPIQVAANVMPIEETIIPLGIKLDAAGEYTFAMPEGTDGIVVELIDYENNTRTNMLLDEYTVNLGKGTFENRFALHVKPNKTTTSLEDVNTNTTGVKKYLIDGVLYMQKDGVLYDAQGRKL